jgi:hypothetical protein
MNKTMKVALCISLVGIGVFVWTQSVSAGKPPSAPVVVTFLSGDVSAAPQALPGPFTATIDFASLIPYICPDSPIGVEGGAALLNVLQSKNPITYSSLTITEGKTGKEPYKLDFKTNIDGVPYTVSMGLFYSNSSKTSTPTLDTFDLRGGGLAVCDSRGRALVIVRGECVGMVNPIDVTFTMTK